MASYTVRNMILSVLPVAALALVWWALPSAPQEQVRPHVEVDATVAYVAQQSDFPVWRPEPGEGWIPTVSWYEARYDTMPTWHLSFETPQGGYLALTQAADVSPTWLDAVLRGGTRTGEAQLPTPTGEQAAEVYEGPRPSNAEVAYVLGPAATGGSTVVVHGTAGEDEVRELLGSVQPLD